MDSTSTEENIQEVRNARLIAAAPDLLAALERAAPIIKAAWAKQGAEGEDLWPIYEQAKAAIAAAKVPA